MNFLSQKQVSRFFRSTQGLTLVEVLIAVSIVLLVVTFLVSINTFYVRVAKANLVRVKAVFLAEEGIEAMRYLRDLSWSGEITTLTIDTPYYLSFTDGLWQATTTPVYIDTIYERTVTLSAVNRNIDDQIAAVGTNDPDTRQITVSVAWWDGSSTTTQALNSYINDLFQN